MKANGLLGIASLSAYLLRTPWALVQFLHNQMAALVTGSFVVTAVGAFYSLREGFTPPKLNSICAREHEWG